MATANSNSDAWIKSALHDGFKALTLGQTQQAAQLCREILAADPERVPAHFLVGLIALEMGERQTAVSAFGSVTRLQPEHGAAWAQLARLFVSAGQANRADRALTQAVRHAGDDAVIADLIGTVYSLLGDQEEARAWYEKATAAEPQSAPYRINLANSLVFLGDTKRAESELQTALGRAPNNAQAHWILSGLKTANDRRHVEVLVRLIAQFNQPPQALAFLFYALGKELEDLQEWPRAFEAFARGAAARRRTFTYDEAAEAEMYAALRATYTSDWLVDDGLRQVEGPAPIFIVGQPRTGTTLVERIITAHSDVHSAGELQQFGLSVRRLLNYRGKHRFSAELVTQAAKIDAEQLGEAYLRASARAQGTKQWFVDKLPSNFLFIPLILRALPCAKIVHLVRDPLDACFASYKQLFADAYPHSYEQGEMARHFVRYHELMAIWRSRFPGRFLDLNYEALTASFEPNARSLIDYLQLPWQDACLNFHAQGGAVTTASAVQVREPVHRGSVGRWRRYQTQLEPMRKILHQAGVLEAERTLT